MTRKQTIKWQKIKEQGKMEATVASAIWIVTENLKEINF